MGRLLARFLDLQWHDSIDANRLRYRQTGKQAGEHKCFIQMVKNNAAIFQAGSVNIMQRAQHNTTQLKTTQHNPQSSIAQNHAAQQSNTDTAGILYRPDPDPDIHTTIYIMAGGLEKESPFII
ncbi:hypothetical protein HELRODRAFT_160975 [Helobdella robusta]|uniref:Uncharacterized protein n=1 Tax=Helobdella robusta TaxID=6412 RepID=T1EQY3_HELRO|nr:hypothetical protein HELRODRAFT_160975 [Helobdella robusta]ESO01808.1 hypothetical protein HELRODRAFT_160975 [Helobdella robusta]